MTVTDRMFMSPPNSYIEALTSSMAASGRVISEEVIKAKQDDKGGGLPCPDRTSVLMIRNVRGPPLCLSPSPRAPRKGRVRTQ